MQSIAFSTHSVVTPAVPILAVGPAGEPSIPQPLALSPVLELRFGHPLLTQPGNYLFSLTLPG